MVAHQRRRAVQEHSLLMRERGVLKAELTHMQELLGCALSEVDLCRNSADGSCVRARRRSRSCMHASLYRR
jgi:hypothetical protein